MATNGHINGATKKLQIVIVGGSLGGLSTGIAVKSLGHDCTILERNPNSLLHNQGAGIVAGGDTLSFFKTYDRCQRPLAVISQRRQYFNKAGEILHKEDMIQNMTSWDLAYYIMRANFDGVESDYCRVPEPVSTDGKGVHLHGHTVTDLKDEGSQVRVFYKKQDGTEASMLADMLVAADGPSSAIRKIFEPKVKRTYAGYCALRGTVPENEASEAARKAFSECFAFFHSRGIQILAYLIPGINGNIEPGHRLINFVYYKNFPEDDRSKQRLLTDADGVFHHITLPPGKMNPKAWETEKQYARDNLPPQFAELVCSTKKPFAQGITDVRSPRNVFMGGKVALIGDALSGFRPHTVASTSQACFDAMSFASYLGGKTTKAQWIKETMQYARFIQQRGVRMGERSQHEDLPLEEHIHDRNIASTPRATEVYPDWTWTEDDEAILREVGAA